MTWAIMAEEEDEIDILGDSDYNLDNLLTKDDGRLGSCYVSGVLGRQGAELLNCDYNIGSHWLLDAPNQSCWYATADEAKSYDRNQFSFPSSLASGVSDSLPSTSQWDDNDSWTDKEKSLLEQGLEIFGHSWTQLAQFIGTKTTHQVKNYVTSQNIHFGQTAENFNFDSSNHGNSEVFNFSELIDDMQIPASMEEVRIKKESSLDSDDDAEIEVEDKDFSASEIITTSNKEESVIKYQEEVKICPRTEKIVEVKLERQKPRNYLDFFENVVEIGKQKSSTQQSSDVSEADNEEVDGKEVLSASAVASELLKSIRDGNVGPGRHVSYGLDMVGEPGGIQPSWTPRRTWAPNAVREQAHECEQFDVNVSGRETKECDGTNLEEAARSGHSHHEVLELIFSMPPPREEVFLDTEVISDDERMIHMEFFEGRSAKTPKRYLKIRNHILECWRQSRPAYITKTSVRTGLKHCGDVNCIGRIHAYLEQIGAINFGCEQARYLNAAAQSIPIVPTHKKISKDELAAMQQARIGAMRPRKKKKNPAFTLDGDGGYTITHSESGEAIHTTVVQDTVSKGNKGQSTKTKTIKLIYCQKYSDSKPAPFIVHMNVEALLVVDMHAHSSHTEVAGLLGGTFDVANSVLYIKRALPCRSNSSGVHCDMCPVSQTEASEKLQGANLEVVGWYHSHPTFLPNPSLQDLSTQSNIQQWFSQTAASPIVSFILAPYCPINPTLASQFRCLTVHSDEIETTPYGTPYMFSVTVTSHGLNVANMLKDMAAIFSLVEENQQVAVDFNSEFQMSPSISFKQKCVESAKLHLASCKPSIPHALQNSVVQGIMQACGTLALARGDCHSRSTS
ncbi:Histone H2A deubiquitinase MYSM1 [Gryllus bimaculatus]|nr:Histone H2A deubiquitinase MYSM1 [Gryllus bimaculatus]